MFLCITVHWRDFDDLNPRCLLTFKSGDFKIQMSLSSVLLYDHIGDFCFELSVFRSVLRAELRCLLVFFLREVPDM